MAREVARERGGGAGAAATAAEDDAKVSDHHAIIPTARPPRLDALERDERRLYDLVARRFLGAFFPDAEFAVTIIVVAVGPREAAARGPEKEAKPDRDAFVEALPPEPDRFVARGRVRTKAGWQEVAGLSGEAKGEAPLLPDVAVGEALAGRYDVAAKQTQPPPRFTEATLLGAMETAGNEIDDEALRLAMKDRGLGTPATRAAVIETLLQRGYVRRDQKLVVPTPLGESLLSLLPVASLASAALTGDWEARLARMARGEEPRAAFMRDIEAYVRSAVREIFHPGAQPDAASPSAAPSAAASPAARSPVAAPSAAASPAAWSLAAPPPATRSPAAPRPRRPAPAASAEIRAEAQAEAGTEGRARERAGAGSKAGAEASAEPLPPCPKCKRGAIIRGKRAWGCERWHEGCALVIPFEREGKPLTAAQLRDLLSRGKTRPATWTRD
ncbi:MAG TPA: DNA topoisomerase, partial [Polyangiaceae bacterium]|nr:DNA topoisomerase [Polyangiaceae bacterium]